MCVGRVRVNLKNFPLYLMYSHWRVPTFTQIDQNKTECETNDSARKQKSKNFNIDE